MVPSVFCSNWAIWESRLIIICFVSYIQGNNKFIIQHSPLHSAFQFILHPQPIQIQMEETKPVYQPLTLDLILEQRIGYGQGHEKLIRPLHFLLFAEGCETIALGILIPVLGDQWSLNDGQKSTLLVSVYVGVALGSFLQTFSDRYGRYPFLLIDSILTSLFGILSCVCSTFQLFTLVRFFYGIGIGIALPLTVTYITETCPTSSRSKIFALTRVSWALGCLTACILGWLLLGQNHWRIFLALITLPNLFSVLDLIKNGRESLRYLWMKKDRAGVIDMIQYLTIENQREMMSEQEIEDAMYQENVVQSSSKSSILYLVQLINEKYRKQTLILTFSWAAACFNAYAITLILPTILARHGNITNNIKYLFLVIVSIIEVISFLSSHYIMENESLGRKRSLIVFNLGFFALAALVILTKERNIILLLIFFMGLKVLATYSFTILHPFTSEIYETYLRSTAMGFFSMCGRISTCILGLVGIRSLDWLGGMGLYVILSLLALTGSALISQMPYCTRGRTLDT